MFGVLRFSGLAAAAVLLAGCQSTVQQPVPSVAFDPAAARYIHDKGSHRIEGQAFLVLRGGSTRLAAGETIRLVPATPYARARFEALYRGRKFLPAAQTPSVSPDPQDAAHTRTTTSNSGGAFRFDDVAPGEYFVTAQKIYRPEESFLPQGGSMYASVTVRPDDRVAVKVVVVGREN